MIVVRKACLADVNEITDVISETFPQDFNYGNGFNRKECLDMLVEAITDKNEMIIIAEVEGKSVGFIHYENKPPTNGTIYLNMIGVRKDFQGKGIGAQLLREGDELALRYFRENCGVKNIATIWLSTSNDNPVGQELYLKNGYVHRGNIIDMVGEGNTELVMVKKVSDVKYDLGERWVKNTK